MLNEALAGFYLKPASIPGITIAYTKLQGEHEREHERKLEHEHELECEQEWQLSASVLFLAKASFNLYIHCSKLVDIRWA